MTEVKLIGEDGNIFSILSKVEKSMKKDGRNGEFNQLWDEVINCGDYNKALQVIMKYVDVR